MQKSIDRLTNQNISAVHQSPSCAICGGDDHLAINCNWGRSAEGDAEQVNVLNNNYRSQNNPYSNFYNPGWRDHPNFSWRNNQDDQPQNQNQSSNQNRSNQGYGQRQFDQGAPQKSNLEQMMEKMMQEQAEFRHDQKRVNQQVTDQIRDLSMKVDLLATHGKLLETQVAQLTSSSSRQYDQLPPKPDCNLNATIKAITLRSGTAYDGPEVPQDAGVHVHQKQPDFRPENHDEMEQEADKGNTNAPTPNQVKGDIPRYVPPHRFIPYPQRLVNTKLDKQYA
jgi:hypothetical protein